MMYKFTYATKIGSIIFVEMDGAISLISTIGKLENDCECVETPLIKYAYSQIKEYLDGDRQSFDFPISLHGTSFQMKVWNALKDIPYGETRSYGQIASIIGNVKASRAVGMANNRNPLLIVIPCHRVIGADGSMTGYASGISIKEFLLSLEKEGTICPIP